MSLARFCNSVKYVSRQKYFTQILVKHINISTSASYCDGPSFVKRFNSISEEKKKEIEAVVAEKTKGWYSLGGDIVDKYEDTYKFSVVNLTLVSFLMCSVIFILVYTPPQYEREWSLREAYLELRRRELNGLPLIDPNLIPIDRIQLPSDEELGDKKIII